MLEWSRWAGPWRDVHSCIRGRDQWSRRQRQNADHGPGQTPSRACMHQCVHGLNAQRDRSYTRSHANRISEQVPCASAQRARCENSYRSCFARPIGTYSLWGRPLRADEGNRRPDALPPDVPTAAPLTDDTPLSMEIGTDAAPRRTAIVVEYAGLAVVEGRQVVGLVAKIAPTANPGGVIFLRLESRRPRASMGVKYRAPKALQ